MNDELIKFVLIAIPNGQLHWIFEEVGAIESEKLLLNVVLQTY